MQRGGTQLTTNNVESGIGGLRIVAGQQVEQADSMLPIEAMKSSANTIAGVNRQYEHYTGKLWDRDTSALQSISVRSDREKKLRPLMELMSVWQRSHLKCRPLSIGEWSALVSINTKGTRVSQTREH